MIPEVIANAAINKTLRCAVEPEAGVLWPIIGGQSLSETPGSANVESTQFFLLRIDFPGEEQAGQFQFNWGIIPGSPIDELLINAGRNKQKITLDFRAPTQTDENGLPEPVLDNIDDSKMFTIEAMDGSGHAKGLSEIKNGDKDGSNLVDGWALNDTIRVGSVIEMINDPGEDAEDLIVIAAIKSLATGKSPKAYVKGFSAQTEGNTLKASSGSYGGFKVFSPNVRYRVTGTGVSFANDSSGAIPIGQLTMTVDIEPVYELIRSSFVNQAYEYTS